MLHSTMELELGSPTTPERCSFRESMYSSGAESTHWKHMNTRASSNLTFAAHRNGSFHGFCQSEQLKTIDMFQNIVSKISILKEDLSKLTHDAFGGTENTPSENCTSCNNTQHSVKLCTSCVAGLNTRCAQSMNALRRTVLNFVKYSNTHIYTEEEKLSNDYITRAINTLIETLPNALGAPELQEHFRSITQKMESAFISCNTCNAEVKAVMITVQQLLLLLSVTDNSPDGTDLIEDLLTSLMQTKFTCDSSLQSTQSVPNCNDSPSENFSHVAVVPEDDELSVQSRFSHIKYNSEADSLSLSVKNDADLSRHREDSSESRNSMENKFDVSKLKTKPEFFKLTHVGSMTESTSTNAVGDSATQTTLITGYPSTSATKLVPEGSLTSTASEEDTPNIKKNGKRKGFRIPKIWRSFGLFRKRSSVQNIPLTVRQPISQQQEAVGSSRTLHAVSTTSFCNASHPVREHQNKTTSSNEEHIEIPSTSFQCTHPSSIEATSKICHKITRMLFKDVRSRLSSKHQNESAFSDSATSTGYPLSSRSSTGTVKTRTERMNVKMTNAGRGFGLNIGFSDRSASVPVIISIEPKSPAEKIGILEVGDRVLAINNKGTLHLKRSQLLSLESKAFTASTITLAVEFDVIDEEFKFGTFDLSLTRTLAFGLVFEEMKKGSPFIVSGVEKGSAASRCGQLFPRDRIKCFKIVKTEVFDPITCDYIKEENMIVTVHRDPLTVLKESEEESASLSSPNPNPRFEHKDSVPRTGLNFVVNSTAVRSVDETDHLVMEHEVVLFRDKIHFDFGIQVTEDEENGHTYISDIRPGSPADWSSVIKKFDRIVEVNGVPVDSTFENSVLVGFEKTDNKVKLLIQRTYHEDSNEA